MNENTMMITIFISLGVLEIILGLPLMYKKIKPNNFYGFRMKKTLSNEKLWYETNKFMGRDFVLSGIALITISLVLLIATEVDLIILTIIETTIMAALIATIMVRGEAFIRNF